MIGTTTLIQLLLLGLLPLVLFVWIGGVGVLAIKRRWVWAGLLTAAGLAGPVWFIAGVLHPFGAQGRLRELDRTEAADGTQLVLTQSRNEDWREPYTVCCWVRPPGGRWGCIMIDFESTWWRSGKIEIHENHARVFRGREQELDVDLKDRTYQLIEGDEPRPPLWVEAGWEPRAGGEFREVLDRAFGPKYEPPKKVTGDQVSQTTTTIADRGK